LDERLLLIEDRLVTAAFSYPFRSGWLEADGVSLAPRVAAAGAAEWPVALLDTVEARAMTRSHVIVRDACVCARRASMLTLATHTRPDDIISAAASLPNVSSTGRAVAAIVVPTFYGITITEMTTERLAVDSTTMVIHEDAAGLIPFDDEESYQEDLGRAWFLFTDTPFVSHVCVARRDLVANDPGSIAATLGRLSAARELARTRGRELRRDLSRDLGIEREVLVDALADQSLSLGAEEQRGVEELWKRAGVPLSAAESRGTFVSIRPR
jgi:predicted solute-binding protein